MQGTLGDERGQLKTNNNCPTPVEHLAPIACPLDRTSIYDISLAPGSHGPHGVKRAGEYQGNMYSKLKL